MKPVLILQHLVNDGPAYLGTWLGARGLAFEVVNAGAGQPFPQTLAGYRALAILGGSMSANDDLPTLRQAEALIREAMAANVPVLGHCLGGQLMARALGATVGPSPAPEIGWQPLVRHASAVAQAWLGEGSDHTVMHWHYESFSLPTGAHWIASSDACPHQAFAIGPHLAMQFHIEIDPPKLQRWLDDSDPKWADALARFPSVQDSPTIVSQAQRHWEAHHALADRIYGRWFSAVA